MNKVKDSNCGSHFTRKPVGPYVLPVSSIHGHMAGSDGYWVFNRTYELQRDSKVEWSYFNFDTEEERHNFYDVYVNPLMIQINRFWKMNQHVYLSYMAWLKDYTHPWTTEQLISYFDLTKEEYDYIMELK